MVKVYRPGLYQPVQLFLIPPPTQLIAEPLVLGPIRVADGIAEGSPFLLIGDDNSHPFVLSAAPIAPMRSHAVIPVACSLNHFAIHGEAIQGMSD